MKFMQKLGKARGAIRQTLDQRHDRRVASTKRELELLKLQRAAASEREKLEAIKARKPSPFGTNDSPLTRIE